MDTGAGVNMIKEDLVINEKYCILLDNDEHRTNKSTTLRSVYEDHKFVIVSNDFPLIDDCIIENFFQKIQLRNQQENF